MKPSAIRSYGPASELSIVSKATTDVFVLSGMGSVDRWARVMTRRAAHVLWYRLTWELFPEKSRKVTGMAQTAPLRPSTQPTITSHLEIVHHAETHLFDVIGMSGQETWQCQIDDRAARQLWAALDVILYPAGWEGASIQINKPN